MALLSGTSSSYSSITSSATSLSAPTSPRISTKFDRAVSRTANSTSRRDVVSAPAAFQPTRSSTGSNSVAGRNSSSGSLSSASSSELLITKSAKAAKKKRNSLSAHNVYATKGPNGLTRVGSGSGAPTGCSLM